MFAKFVFVGALLPAIVLADPTRPLEKRASCPASCSGCCDALYPAGCYAPVSGPGAGQYACYSYPPGDVVSTVYGSYSASYSASYPINQPFSSDSYYSSDAYPTSSSYYISPEQSSDSLYGPAPTPHRSHHKTPVNAASTSAFPSSSAAAAATQAGTGAADTNHVAFGVMIVLSGVVGLAVLL